MPNHCCNTLFTSASILSVIIGNYVAKNENDESIFDFERIVPIGNVPDWYKKRLKKWGTTSIGYDLNISEDRFEFFTALVPPVPIIKKLAELYKGNTFRLEYYEPGIAFRGLTIAKYQGRKAVLKDHCWKMTEQDLTDLGFSNSLNPEKLE